MTILGITHREPARGVPAPGHRGRALAVAALICGLAASSQTWAIGPDLPRKEKDVIPKGPSGPVEQQFPFGANWILSDVNGKSAGGDAPSFRLDDKLRATGYGGCNSFSMALYPIKGQKLAAGAIATTRKSCGKPIDDLERNMLVGLHSMPTWHLESNGDLTVLSPVGTMHFRRGL